MRKGISGVGSAALVARGPVFDRVVWTIAITWWVVSAGFEVALRFLYPETRLTLFVDARLYRLASLAWLEGRDPWGDLGLFPYAAPPPTLLFMAPFALVDEAVAIPVFMGLSVATAVFAVRRLDLPWVFLLWPPLFGAMVVGNPNAMLVGLLLTRAAPLAVFAKIYAVIPLAGELRWRALAVSGTLLVLTIPILPWGAYVAALPTITEGLTEQSQNISAWGTPLLFLVIPALVLLGRRDGGWLAVPAAWPSTQLGYNSIALPVVRGPLLALALSISLPFVTPVAVIVLAASRVASRGGLRTRQPTDGPAKTGS